MEGQDPSQPPQGGGVLSGRAEWRYLQHSGLDVNVERLFDHVDERRQVVGFEIAGDATCGVRSRQLHTILTAYLAQRLVDGRVLKMESWWLLGVG